MAGQGGIALGGSAIVSRGKIWLPSGGLTFGGAAATESASAGAMSKSYVASGGISFSGAALCSFTSAVVQIEPPVSASVVRSPQGRRRKLRSPILEEAIATARRQADEDALLLML